MKFENLITVVLFVLCFGTFVSAQNEETIMVYQGTSLNVQIAGDVAAPIIKVSPTPEENTLELTEVIGSDYVFTYTPDPSFLGYDYFMIDEIISIFPLPEAFPHEFSINVVASMVQTNDDFVKLNSQETILIDPRLNDESSAGNLVINIAQVQNGSASINADGIIEYTPSESEKDYIVYTVSDMYGSSSNGTIYISDQGTEPTGDTDDALAVHSNSSVYILMPWDDYIHDGADLNHGSLTTINDYVFEYTAEVGADGNEDLIFTNTNGDTHTVAVDVIEKYTDVGFVRDDLFYTASNTQTYINVKDNDITGQYVISDYSEELIHLGDGLFSYTPPQYFSGTKTFSYSGDNGTEIETGEIKIVVSNFKPTNYFEYELSSPKNQPRVVEYEVPIGSEYFEIASYPYHGSLEVFTEDEEIDLACEDAVQKVFAVYTPNEDYVGADNIILRYCASDNNTCNDVSIAFDIQDTDIDECICVDDCVWPGDANGDGKVSVVDVLSVGRYMGAFGPERSASPFGDIYEGAKVASWIDTQANGRSVGHSDSNGDGIVTTDDLDEIIANYGNINSIVANDLLGVKNVPLTFNAQESEIDSGELLTIDISLGNDLYPAIDMQGIAFAINFPGSFVDSSSVKVEFLEEEYFVKNAPFISLTHQPIDGLIHVAGVKTNSKGSTGGGLIATLSFIVEEDAEGIRNGKRSASESSDLIVEVTDIVFEGSDGLKYALPNSTLTIERKEKEVEAYSNISLYPNPVIDQLVISTKDHSNINSVEIMSLSGELMMTIKDIKNMEATLPTSELSQGMYVMKVNSDAGVEIQKFIKQ